MELSDFEFWITEQHLLYLLQYHIVPGNKLLFSILILLRYYSMDCMEQCA